jgi:uncharacterized membrane protein
MESAEKKLVRPKVTKILYIVSGLLFLNVLLSAYLAYEFYFPSDDSVCSINAVFDCQTVAETEYAVLFGVPVAIWGVLFYTGLFIGVFGVALKLPFHKIYKKFRPGVVLNIVRYFSYFGLLFSLYLTYIEAAVIYVFCPFCLTQQVFIIVVVGLLVWTNNIIKKGKEETKVCEFC